MVFEFSTLQSAYVPLVGPAVSIWHPPWGPTGGTLWTPGVGPREICSCVVSGARKLSDALVTEGAELNQELVDQVARWLADELLSAAIESGCDSSDMPAVMEPVFNAILRLTVHLASGNLLTRWAERDELFAEIKRHCLDDSAAQPLATQHGHSWPSVRHALTDRFRGVRRQVAEEGLDIPSANCVIRFDPIVTPVSLVKNSRP